MSVLSTEILLIHFFFPASNPNTIPRKEVFSKYLLEEKMNESLNECGKRGTNTEA